MANYEQLLSRPVLVRYPATMDPSNEDPTHRVLNEQYESPNIEIALEAHPRADIVRFIDESDPLGTTKAKRMLATAKKRYDKGQEEDNESTDNTDPSVDDVADVEDEDEPPPAIEDHVSLLDILNEDTKAL